MDKRFILPLIVILGLITIGVLALMPHQLPCGHKITRLQFHFPTSSHSHGCPRLEIMRQLRELKLGIQYYRIQHDQSPRTLADLNKYINLGTRRGFDYSLNPLAGELEKSGTMVTLEDGKVFKIYENSKPAHVHRDK